MKWQKKGLIYCPYGKYGWDNNSAMTPTPILIKNEEILRVYASFRDENGIGRIGYIDLDPENPSKIKNVSANPVLDIGFPGSFDDNGVILGDVIEINNSLYMYYVGFQIVSKAKFLAFSGLAISNDGGNTFIRIQNCPVLDRTQESIYIRAIHTARYENGIFKIWYAVGNGWEIIQDKPYPKYYIKYNESKDGLHFNESGIKCLEYNVSRGEYRIGRPRVYNINGKYIMFYTYGTIHGDYMVGYAESENGIEWQRKYEGIGIELSKDGWDSKSICYPSIITVYDKIYIFYNGNDMGKTGFGYAELLEW